MPDQFGPEYLLHTLFCVNLSWSVSTDVSLLLILTFSKISLLPEPMVVKNCKKSLVSLMITKDQAFSNDELSNLVFSNRQKAVERSRRTPVS